MSKRAYAVGEVSVPCSARTARIAAEWLEREFVPSEPTLLGGPEIKEHDRAMAAELAKKLAKAARRERRGNVFKVKLPRKLATWFAGHWDSVAFVPSLRGLLPRHLLGLCPPAIADLARGCHDAVGARNRVGGTKRRLTPSGMTERVVHARNAKKIERLEGRLDPPGSGDITQAWREGLEWRHRRKLEAQLKQAAARPHKSYDARELRRLKKRRESALRTAWLLRKIRRSGHTLLSWPGWENPKT
jgi:hypothetical protein